MSYDDSFISEGLWYSASAIDRGNEIAELRAERCEQEKIYWKEIFNDDYHDLDSFYLLKKKKNFLNKVSSLENKSDLEKVYLNEVFKEILDRCIYAYQKEESLPQELIEIARNEECLSILIKGILKKYALVELNPKHFTDIEKHIKEQHTIHRDLIVYDRVGELQKFIHRFVDEFYQAKAHLLIPSEIMRKSLSTARLYFSLHDLKSNSIEELLKKGNETESRVSSSGDTDTRILKNKKFIRNWKVRHYTDLWHLSMNESITNLRSDLSSNLNEANELFQRFQGKHGIEDECKISENKAQKELGKYKVAMTNIFISWVKRREKTSKAI